MNKTNSSHVVILILLIIVAVAMFVYSMTKGTETNYENTMSENGSDANSSEPAKDEAKPISSGDQKTKADILAKVSVKSVVLTPNEKADIFAAIQGDNINKYGFTAEETKLIIEALNRK